MKLLWVWLKGNFLALQDWKIKQATIYWLFSNLILDTFSEERVRISVDQQWDNFYSAFSRMTLKLGTCDKIFRSEEVTETFQSVRCDTEGDTQEDIAKLKYWEKKCQMVDYVSKWNIIQSNSCLCDSDLGSGSQEVTIQEGDLGPLASSFLKSSVQCVFCFQKQ